MAALVPDDSLFHFALPKNIIFLTKWVIFHLGQVLRSNALFMDDGVQLLARDKYLNFVLPICFESYLLDKTRRSYQNHTWILIDNHFSLYLNARLLWTKLKCYWVHFQTKAESLSFEPKSRSSKNEKQQTLKIKHIHFIFFDNDVDDDVDVRVVLSDS